MGTVDIIPDIHGQIAKLRGALDALGWWRSPAGWIHSDPERTIVFLGDFIDRGPENRAVIHLVRDLIDSGKMAVDLNGTGTWLVSPRYEECRAKAPAWVKGWIRECLQAKGYVKPKKPSVLFEE